MMTPPLDLRSDTITQPTAAMRQAIAQAPVGDDVLGDDPSVHALEERVAHLLGKEAAVFMPSGTMTNQVALRVHTEPGDEVILESQAHIYYYEGGAPAALAGVMSQLIAGDRGIFTAADLRAVLRPVDVHFPVTKLVCLENTHNRGGGRIFPLSEIQALAQVCQTHGLILHLDGARLWNACIATGISPQAYSAPFDTVSVCFSKGLGAPVGSALAGSVAQMQRARRFRKQYGGGMRQAGLLAAGALYALDHQYDRLQEDHDNARYCADILGSIEGFTANAQAVDTNIVIFETPGRDATAMAQALRDQGVWVNALGGQRLRAVTSLMVTRSQLGSLADRAAAALASLSPTVPVS
ncbi:threonine aldolase family protein [Prochlorothrix hollandica]|uniref:Threonine aldolase n=1 Tax=Prochlorothrix hollandica PCC 9006 = CALU 1027 TaxID=317619 RepID=A0A0M2PTX7_PROHO|nr:threonine aldolase [Prochlorothrix hollandica PCC 9006 = CALU 1027]